MRIVASFPHKVREIENLWIPLADGTRLAARAWLPASTDQEPVPAIIEYIPYGKRDGTRDRDEPMHHWLAGHGYAALRIDLRGSGESDGLLLDEYLPRELADGVEAIAWIAAQPWCDGKVGMIGKSWGGFNALQIAALRPPALRTVVSVCSTDDRYSDDAHYMGGCLLNDNLWWGAVFFQLCALPPDPALVGERWRDMWRERLESCTPHPARWMRHPLRDAYWRHGSVCERYEDIACPVYAVGGWADGYSDAIPRLVSRLATPCRAVIGPWGHQYPHEGVPGPAIGFLQDVRRWCDQWLRGVETGIATEPAYRVWMPESVPAGLGGRDRPGRWVAESTWPSPRIETRRLGLARGRLSGLGPLEGGTRLEICSPQTVGRAAGGLFSTGLRDQREDDAGSLCFDGEPLTERVEILGAPQLRVVVASDRRRAFLVARLCDVAPDGSSTRVSYAVLNLTHRSGHRVLEALEPGERHEITLQLHDCAHAFPPGHRLRLALSTAYWPLVWPSPEPVTLTLWTAGGALSLPVRPPDPRDAELPPFEPAESAPGPSTTVITRGHSERQSELDPVTGELRTLFHGGYDDEGNVALACHDAVGIEGGDITRIQTCIHPSDPLRARVSMAQRTALQRPGWRVEIASSIEISCTRDDFILTAHLDAREGAEVVLERSFAERIPRVGI